MTVTPVNLHNLCRAAFMTTSLGDYDAERMTSMLRMMASFGWGWLNHSRLLEYRLGPVIAANFRPVQYATPVDDSVTNRCITPEEMAEMLRAAAGHETVLISHSESWWTCTQQQLMSELKKEAAFITRLLERRRPDDCFSVRAFVTDTNSMPVFATHIGDFNRQGFVDWAAKTFCGLGVPHLEVPVAVRTVEHHGYSVTINGLSVTGYAAKFEDELMV